jgi:hypothetical protein
MTPRTVLSLGILLSGAQACSSTPAPAPVVDAGTVDATSVDAGAADVSVDAGASDAGTDYAVDAAPVDLPGTAQLPPTGSVAAIEAWLAKGEYKAWKCEKAPHDARPNSPHEKNRVCSNDKVSAHTTGEYPVGSASVKEFYDPAGQKVTGHAFYRKTQMGKGESFYWFEKVGTQITTNTQNASDCAGCHVAAGSDAAHTGHDYVYTQVQ